MLVPVFAGPTPIIWPTPPDPLLELEFEFEPPLVDEPVVDPPMVAPLNPAESAEPPLTVVEPVVEPGVVPVGLVGPLVVDAAPPKPVPRVEAEPRFPPAPVVFNPPSGWPKNPFTVVLFSPT